jgi:drug/metabolite transporter (DMT)-like permease
MVIPTLTLPACSAYTHPSMSRSLSDISQAGSVNKRITAELFLLGTTFIWGGTFVIVKVGLEDISPMLLVAVRFSIATALFSLFFYKQILPMRREALRKGSWLGLLLFLGFVLQTVGLNGTTPSKSAFITGTLVIFTPIFQFIIEKRAPKIGNIFGIVVVTVGLWFLTAPASSLLRFGFSLGDGLTLLCAVVFGAYIVYLDLISKEVDIPQLTFLQMFSTSIYAWVSVFIFERPRFLPTANVLWTLAYSATLATILTTYVQTRYQRDTTPTRAAIIFTLEPVWAAVLSYLMINETIGPTGMLGAGLIILGILISELL